ncbi:MAG: PEGA domain-containing protein, partial [Deltaproteobacteria bacterium]|nr:PEGA domain-containing protein [Deltaproteobacteria bacterium]
AYAAQNFAAAVASFEEAYKLVPLPEIAFSAAQAYRRQYRVEARPEYVKRAVELYTAYLAKVKTGGRVGDAADSLGEMQRELDRLQASGTKIELAVVERTRLGVTIAFVGTTDDTNTTALREIGDATGEATKGIAATLDGRPIEPFALIDVEPGDHVFRVEAEGYEPVERTRRAVKGDSALVDMPLKAKPAKVTIATEAGTRVMVDGRPAGTLPMGALELAAGKHVITLLRAGREPVARELSVTRGEIRTIRVPLVQTARRRAVPWVLGGAGVLAIGAAVTTTLAVIADGNATDLRAGIAAGDRPTSDADAYDRDVRRRDRFVATTWVVGGGAVLAGLIGAGLYLFDAPSAEGVSVTPAISAGGAGAFVTGRF